jgi:DNA mismatch repair protein MutS2
VADAEARVGRRRLRPKDVRKARKVLDRTAKTVAPAGPVDKILKPAAPAGRPAAAADLEVGARVWITAMNHEGVILRAPEKDRVRVAAGSIQLNVALGDLRLLAPAAGHAAAGRDAVRRPFRRRSDIEPEFEEAPVQTPENSLDLRGLYADEAVDKIEPFLDSLMQRGRTAGFLIHGHGTGALKKAVRGHLEKSRYVVRHRPGGPGEGGDGVTVVWIR